MLYVFPKSVLTKVTPRVSKKCGGGDGGVGDGLLQCRHAQIPLNNASNYKIDYLAQVMDVYISKDIWVIELVSNSWRLDE